MSREGPRAPVPDAIADYSAALELDPKNVEILFNRIAAYHAKGNREGAIADAERALEIAPTEWPKRATLRRFLEELRR